MLQKNNQYSFNYLYYYSNWTMKISLYATTYISLSLDMLQTSLNLVFLSSSELIS